jgi:hypothetical protein
MRENYGLRQKKMYSDYENYSTSKLEEMINSDKYNSEVVSIIEDIIYDRNPLNKDVNALEINVTNEPRFLYIPIYRLVIMNIISFGLYECYWIYKNWKYIKERNRPDILPFWRGIFSIFFCHSLLDNIKYDTETNAIIKAEFSASNLATGWVILITLGNILARTKNITAIYIGLIIAIFSFLFFLPVQIYINKVCDSMNPKPKYYNWSTGHLVCIVIGILYWLIIIFGLILKN